MTSVLLVGVGNEFRADDAAGMLAVREAGGRFGDRVRILEATDDLTRVIDHIRSTERIIFVDAIVSADPPGTVRVFDLLKPILARRRPTGLVTRGDDSPGGRPRNCGGAEAKGGTSGRDSGGLSGVRR